MERRACVGATRFASRFARIRKALLFSPAKQGPSRVGYRIEFLLQESLILRRDHRLFSSHNGWTTSASADPERICALNFQLKLVLERGSVRSRTGESSGRNRIISWLGNGLLQFGFTTI